jgi:hypothetical protein
LEEEQGQLNRRSSEARLNHHREREREREEREGRERE